MESKSINQGKGMRLMTVAYDGIPAFPSLCAAEDTCTSPQTAQSSRSRIPAKQAVAHINPGHGPLRVSCQEDELGNGLRLKKKKTKL